MVRTPFDLFDALASGTGSARSSTYRRIGAGRPRIRKAASSVPGAVPRRFRESAGAGESCDAASGVVGRRCDAPRVAGRPPARRALSLPALAVPSVSEQYALLWGVEHPRSDRFGADRDSTASDYGRGACGYTTGLPAKGHRGRVTSVVLTPRSPVGSKPSCGGEPQALVSRAGQEGRVSGGR